LHENSGECLRQTVMNLLSDARPLDEDGGFLRGVSQPSQLNSQRRLLREGDQQLTVLNFRCFATEGENEESNVASTKHQRVNQYAGIPFTTMEGQCTGPDLPVATLNVHVARLGAPSKYFGERRSGERHARRKRSVGELTITYVSQHAPFLQRI